jgi:hypothetical protein
MDRLIEVVNSAIKTLPTPDLSLMKSRKREVWIGVFWWVVFYRTGQKSTIEMPSKEILGDEAESIFSGSQPFGFMYAQLLNLCIGIFEAKGKLFISYEEPISLWYAAILEAIDVNFSTSFGYRKGALRTINSKNASLLKSLKSFDFIESEGSAMGDIYSLASLIAKGQSSDSPDTREKRNRFRKYFWKPYLMAIADLNAEFRSEVRLLIEQSGNLYELTGGRTKRPYYLEEPKGFKSGRGRKSK